MKDDGAYLLVVASLLCHLVENIAGCLADKIIELFVCVHSSRAQGFQDGSSEVEELFFWLLVHAQLSQREGNSSLKQPIVVLILDLLIILIQIRVRLHTVCVVHSNFRIFNSLVNFRLL